jgi:hypothetical protein
MVEFDRHGVVMLERRAFAGQRVQQAAAAAAQLELRAAISPWMDEPIDYPVLVDSEPDEPALAQLASRFGLPATTWRYDP